MQTGAMGTAVGAPPPCSRCSTPPPVLFLLATLAMTTFSTAMLCAAIMTDHWEHITWDRDELEKLTNGSIHWLLDGSVARMGSRGTRGGAFLVPVHGGIWTLCVSLSEPEMRLLGRVGFPKGTALNGGCKNYLAGSDGVRGEEQRADWQHRMQNLSISCSLVCLIILGSAALVGAFGVCAKQISAVLVTGVMYLLAALFALFTLMIIHFKRHQGRALLEGASADNSADGVLGGGRTGAVLPLLGARQFTTSWSLDLGWGGVSLCTITSLLWILLSKIMRFNPLSAMI